MACKRYANIRPIITGLSNFVELARLLCSIKSMVVGCSNPPVPQFVILLFVHFNTVPSKFEKNILIFKMANFANISKPKMYETEGA